MKLKISNHISLTNLSKEILGYIKKNFKIANPEYEKLKHMGKWVGNTPKELFLYKQDGDNIHIPVGLFKQLKKEFDFSNVEKEIDLADDKDNNLKEFNVELYEYQQKAVDVMAKKGFGILIAPTGSGKTQMGIALACKLSYKTLWLTHTKDLLKQSYDRAKQYIPKELLGTITDGKIDIKDGITFATVQTLAKQDLQQFKYTFNAVIVDECHRVAGTPSKLQQFSKVLDNLAARHKIGLTATLHRADGLEKTTMAYLGDIAYQVEKENVADKIIPPKIYKINTYIEMPECALDTDGTINNHKLLEYLSNEPERNQVILQKLLSNKTESNLILGSRLDILNNLYDMLPSDLKEQAIVFSAKLNKKAREKAITDMQQGNLKYMFATYSLAKEGLDIPRLNRLYLVHSSKDNAVVQQSVGRVMRVFENKAKPIVYDFVDDYIKARKDFTRRKAFYKQIGGEIFE